MSQHIETIRLVSGEEIIYKTESDGSEDTIIALKPRIFALQQVAANTPPQIVMIPLFMGAPDEPVVIQREHIVACVPVLPKSLEDAYLSQSTNIQL